MKFLITRTERKFTVVEAKSETEAIFICEAGLVPEDRWEDDDRPYEFTNDLGEPYTEEKDDRN